MSFQFSERHADEYRTQGYTVFRGILPPSLITDLRRVCEEGRRLARLAQGAQTQRFQPVTAFDIPQKPFEDFRDLPALCDAISRVTSPAHSNGGLERLGVLLEPADLPYCTHWHRDWRDNIAGLDVAAWEAVSQDPDLFGQSNCALYQDGCTWVVPGSHRRDDTPEEAALFPDRPIPGPYLEGKDAAERERLCLDYCRRMPGAERLILDAGDYALYRNTLWHLGNYVPYTKRATLHSSAETPRYVAWAKQALEEAARRRAAGLEWETPRRTPQPAAAG